MLLTYRCQRKYGQLRRSRCCCETESNNSNTLASSLSPHRSIPFRSDGRKLFTPFCVILRGDFTVLIIAKLTFSFLSYLQEPRLSSVLRSFVTDHGQKFNYQDEYVKRIQALNSRLQAYAASPSSHPPNTYVHHKIITHMMMLISFAKVTQYMYILDSFSLLICAPSYHSVLPSTQLRKRQLTLTGHILAI